MGLSTTRRFLVEATRTAAGDYFRWRQVGVALGHSEAEAGRLIQSLNDRKLIILLRDGDARLLTAGRDLARQLEAKSSSSSSSAAKPVVQRR
jgi:hypothetical protein